ncbi:J domain-containing protein [Tahibacter amnicola]|uniref:J domain-containing protein n=1 Tax=Tahibacter amnicola TaxID=2976241 RepID=A0ABY6B8Z3_9GAMM|nr:J domain-containing protein [Tahibacter amnicola]UXI66345.1 J domain-containing protein [Tahibacter amnicola]
MRYAQPTEYLADYASLGVRPGCTPDELKGAWRRIVGQSHPDRTGDCREAADRLHEATAAYRRLQAFHRRHGHLPGRPVETVAPPAEAPAAPPSPLHVAARVMSTQLFRRAALAVAAVAILVPTAIALRPANTESVVLRPQAPAAAFGPPVALRPPVAPEPKRQLRLGDTVKSVRAMLGKPTREKGETWYYGNSSVRFSKGRVVDWYSTKRIPLAGSPERPPGVKK